MKKNLRTWVIAKSIVTTIFLIYAVYNYFSPALYRDDESELLLIEFAFYTITSLLLIYFFFRLYQTIIFVIFFDFIFLFFIAYHFHLNYIVLFLDLISICFIILDNNNTKSFIKRKLRTINIHVKNKTNDRK